MNEESLNFSDLESNYHESESESAGVFDDVSYYKEYLAENNYSSESSEVILDYSWFEKKDELFKHEFDDCIESVLEQVSAIVRSGELRHVAIQVSNYNRNVLNIRDIRNYHIGKLINIDCVIRKVSDIKQQVVYASYKCLTCGEQIPLFEVDERMIRPPGTVCPRNTAHTKMVIDPRRCVYRDIQIITVQERQAEGGRQPKSIGCIISSKIVDKLQAGNRVRVTGYVKVRIDTKNIASLYIEVLNVKKSEDDFSEVTVEDTDMTDIIEFSKRDDVYKLFVDSINPSIYGYDYIKLGLVMCMFGGVTVRYEDGTRARGESHILLCGDPSTAKSQLIYAVSKIMPRVVYTSGKSTSAAGLTAAAVRDETDGKWTLEAGALPLANGGVVVCDEFDKLSADDRSALHEAMEFGSISINKAGLSEKLDTETTLIAAANPKAGRFIRGVPLKNQLDLPPSLISRFDLIFTMIDEPNESIDLEVARKVLMSKRYHKTEVERPLTIEFMRKYITYAKTIMPEITDSAIECIASEYNKLRNHTPDAYITARQLGALERLAEASARIKLRNKVTIEDAKRAVEIYGKSMESISLDGKIDVSLLDSTSSMEENTYKEYALMVIGNDKVSIKKMIELLVLNHGLEYDQANDILMSMIEEGLIMGAYDIATDKRYLKVC